ncbi:MAG TPA: DUF1501 domain-containing protein, partial [Verrucomicrobiae bacterium]|nr:DUF1501 domain-containing protein [Verrucomicrobiae bacterium]
MSALKSNCAGIRRRDFLQLGLRGVLGLGFCDLLRLRAGATELGGAAKRAPRPGSNVNCILIWLDGGPSHYETFDPKPDAPSEIRGEFKDIATPLPGVHFSESIPKLAAVADKFTILRSL